MSEMYTSTIESRFKIFAPMLKASLDTDGRMRLHGVASSTITDRHGDTITLSALSDMERAANSNMTIFLNHEYKVPEDVAGSVERALIRSHPQDSSIHDLVLDIVVNDANPRAVDAWTAIQKGTQLGLSIGAMIPEGGASRDRKSGAYTIEHVELLETSLVGVPANPRSWVEYAVKSLNLTPHAEDLLELLDPGEKIAEADGIVKEGIEVPLGETGELVVKAPMSSDSRNALPDSAFACPAKRKYPHHTKLGAVDKAHLRNALSRCGDSSNDQCGCAHIRAHAKSLGMGEAGEKSLDELLVFALENGVDESHFTVDVEEGPTFEYDWDLQDAAEITLAKKPATHEHPHAHEHDHEHEHWNGIVHSHDHNHTHAHEHDDSHEHIDDRQGSEHDHSHVGSYGDNEHPHDVSKSIESLDMTAEDLAEHLAAFEAANHPVPIDGDGAVVASQEALSSVPENEGEVVALAADLADESEVEEVSTALQVLEPTVVASLRTSSDLLKAITRELIDTKKSLADATAERDQAMFATEKVVTKMSEILTALSKTPVGRRAVAREATDQFETLKSVYSEEFLTLLKKG